MKNILYVLILIRQKKINSEQKEKPITEKEYYELLEKEKKYLLEICKNKIKEEIKPVEKKSRAELYQQYNPYKFNGVTYIVNELEEIVCSEKESEEFIDFVPKTIPQNKKHANKLIQSRINNVYVEQK